ncbi:MAG: pseudouridine synthase [Flavobacteriales bacterium]
MNRKPSSRKNTEKLHSSNKNNAFKGKFKPKKRFVHKKKKNKETSDEDGIRLNKYIARAGLASRREADELIKTGVVEINGKIIQEMGYKVQPTDVVRFDGKEIKAEKKVYVLLNKPKGFITTTKDEKGRKTVMELVSNASPYRIYPVGRLDRPTTGVLLLTNDGDMAKKLTHPKHNIKKIYHVTLNKNLSGSDLYKIIEGIELEEGTAMVDKISYIEGKKKNEIGMEIHIGWNRVIRRIFSEIGYEVIQLDRVYFAGLTKKGVKRGNWKILTEQEVNYLRML